MTYHGWLGKTYKKSASKDESRGKIVSIILGDSKCGVVMKRRCSNGICHHVERASSGMSQSTDDGDLDIGSRNCDIDTTSWSMMIVKSLILILL